MAINSKTALSLCLLALAGAHALAAEPIDDAQQQARILLTGKSFGVSAGPVLASGSRTRATPVDRRAEEGAHEMARRMIGHGAL
jgi:hypothetical protein